MWSSLYAAYERLPEGLKRDLEARAAVHDMGDFRNSFAEPEDGRPGFERLNDALVQFGCSIRPLVATHPVTGRKFLNFNESFVSHVVGLTASESNALKTFLANHMN